MSKEIQVPVRDSKLAAVKVEKFLLVRVGDMAPAFAVKTIDGKEIKLSDFRGKLVLIDFWATWCGPCVAELPNIKKIHDEYADDGLVVLSLSFDADAKTVKRFAARREMRWPQVLAEGAHKGALAKAYGVSAIPATFLVGPDGKVIAKDLRGGALPRRVKQEIARLKKRQAVAAGDSTK